MTTVKARKIDFTEKTDEYSETCQTISHMGSPVQESCTPGSTGGEFREGHVYQPKLHIRIL